MWSVDLAGTYGRNDTGTIGTDESSLALCLENIRYANHVWELG